MHPLVRSIVLRAPRRDALVHDAQLHPPHVQGREASEAAGRERIPVIGPNGLRQPDLPKHGFEHGPGLGPAHRRQALAHQASDCSDP